MDLRSETWTQFIDPEERVELVVPTNWDSDKENHRILALHTTDDAWTAIQLEYHTLDRLSFDERVIEPVNNGKSVWRCKRVFGLVHNGLRALQGEFSLRINGKLWRRRTLYLPHSDGLFALSFMSSVEAWPRYILVCNSVFRSFQLHTKRKRPRAWHIDSNASIAAR